MSASIWAQHLMRWLLAQRWPARALSPSLAAQHFLMQAPEQPQTDSHGAHKFGGQHGVGVKKPGGDLPRACVEA
ncbi:MAG: hypothetical protein FJY26_08860 [Betaproteobacteria bacterium]|nr:hypothetical protein [Betaproteobacteria bacterium]